MVNKCILQISLVLRRFHPEATMWISAQQYSLENVTTLMKVFFVFVSFFIILTCLFSSLILLKYAHSSLVLHMGHTLLFLFWLVSDLCSFKKKKKKKRNNTCYCRNLIQLCLPGKSSCNEPTFVISLHLIFAHLQAT